ncbi:MAG TPA: hypothetical protein VES62_15225 [Thermoleophilaceae bacterium]|nr:hypothetical protein [Actinomycetota bacterium]HYN52270.1 hypothetical protein [Thermoleophilaceae bacterium]
MRFRVLVPVGAVALALTASADAAPVVTEFPVPTANSTPQDIVQAPDGSLWFTELGANKIAKVTPGDPPVIQEFDVLDGLTNPLNITVGPDGNIWYTGTVAAAGGVGRINPANPADVQAYGGFGIAGDPRGIAAGPDGNLWVTDPGTDVAIRISPAGLEIGADINLDPVNSVNPRNVTRGPGNTMWVAGFGGYIVRITGDGATATSFDTPGNSAWDITPAPDGNLWYTAPNTAIGKITPGGVSTEYPLPVAATDPFGLTVGPDGAIWFAQAVGNSIGRGTTADPPVLTDLGGLTAASRPEYIAPGPQNTLWFTEKDGNRIGRITGIDVPQPPSGARPVVSGLTLSPKRFRLGRRLPSASAVKTGTTIRYNLSEASTVTLSFARAFPGRRAGGRCVKPRRRNRTRRRCTRYVSVKRKLTFPGQAAGARRISFAGRLTRRKSLRPGPYRLNLRARDAAGNSSLPVRTKFRLLPRKPKRR